MSERRERVFLRGFSGETYGLGEHLKSQRAAPRVKKKGTGLLLRHDGLPGYSTMGAGATAEWIVGPGDDPFLTQSVQVHTVDLARGGHNEQHAHQNEALWYVISGRGYEIHDTERYEWEGGDAVIVHTDSVHMHYNASQTEPVHGVIFKAKALWLYLGLWQQGRPGPFEHDGYGARESWDQLRTPGVTKKRKIVKKNTTKWEDTRDGRVRVITSGTQSDVRFHSLDLTEVELAPGQKSAKHWHMADEVLHIESGAGRSHHWDVLAEIADRYYARVAERPSTWDFAEGDTVYIPHNTIHQHENTGHETLRFVSAQNRIFKLIGYDTVVYRD